MNGSAPNKQEVEEKEKRLRESIAKNYSHIKNVEVQLAQLQLQLNLTSGPKKSALEMLRKKIEAKNEQVVTARQRFLSAQKAAEQAEDILRCYERSKEQLCQELHLLVHQSTTAELNKLEQLTKQLDQLNRGTLGHQTVADMPALEPAMRAAASSHATSAQDAAAATTEQQALAAADLAGHLQDSSEQNAPTVFVSTGQSSKKLPPKQQQQLTTGGRVASADHMKQASAMVPAQSAVKKKSNQLRKQLPGPQESSVQAANDMAGKFVGFQS